MMNEKLLEKRERAAKEALHALGVTRNYDGYPSMAAALALVMTDESYLRRLTKKLYPALAERFQTTAHSLQRNFRTIIDVCFRDENKHKLEEFTGQSFGEEDKLSITGFLDSLMTYLLRQEEAKKAQEEEKEREERQKQEKQLKQKEKR